MLGGCKQLRGGSNTGRQSPRVPSRALHPTAPGKPNSFFLVFGLCAQGPLLVVRRRPRAALGPEPQLALYKVKCLNPWMILPDQRLFFNEKISFPVLDIPLNGSTQNWKERAIITRARVPARQGTFPESMAGGGGRSYEMSL